MGREELDAKFKRLTQQLILADAYRRDTVFASLLMTWKSLKKVCGVEKRPRRFLAREIRKKGKNGKPHKLDQGMGRNLASLRNIKGAMSRKLYT